MDQEKPEIKMVPLQDIRIDVTPETVTLDAQPRAHSRNLHHVSTVSADKSTRLLCNRRLLHRAVGEKVWI
jgi:hypothetical protein